MDSYNREYGAGIEIGDVGVGLAKYNDHEASGVDPVQYHAWQDAGFYAVAYTITDGSQIDGLETDDVVIS